MDTRGILFHSGLLAMWWLPVVPAPPRRILRSIRSPAGACHAMIQAARATAAAVHSNTKHNESYLRGLL
jgi:hypothetical protein